MWVDQIKGAARCFSILALVQPLTAVARVGHRPTYAVQYAHRGIVQHTENNSRVVPRIPYYIQHASPFIGATILRCARIFYRGARYSTVPHPQVVPFRHFRDASSA